jgi:hypothetical protein
MAPCVVAGWRGRRRRVEVGHVVKRGASIIYAVGKLVE